MSNYKRRPDYTALYPDVEISEEVLAFLKASDRKLEYLEYDLKRDRALKDVDGKTVRDENGLSVLLPEREVSLDKLIGEDWDFPSPEHSPENILFEKHSVDSLYSCINLLDSDERELIAALFFEGLTIREYAEITGKTKSTVDRSKTKILGKLKNMLIN